MQLTVRAQRIPLSPALRDHAERRLQFALGRYIAAIQRVRLHLVDVNGPRGGTDKRCIVVVGLRRAGEVVLEAVDTDLRVLIDRAADRTGRAVGRRLKREQRADAEGSWRGA